MRVLVKDEIKDTILRYLDEETDGEFLRYYRLNPVCLPPLVDDILSLLDPSSYEESPFEPQSTNTP